MIAFKPLLLAVVCAGLSASQFSEAGAQVQRPCKVEFTGPYPSGATQYYIANNKCYTSHYQCQVIVNGQVHQQCVPPRGGKRIYTAKTLTSDKVRFKIIRTTRCY
jgi:hypothetical protein